MGIGKIEFGTAGLRGVMGQNPGQINIETIQIVTQGLANYILTFPKEEWKGGVVICHDSRIHSREFAEQTAKVFAGNGITAHLTQALRPTPFASFAIRYYGCIAGVNITASHNPKEYNGYKVYWADGAQIVPPHDEEIMKAVHAVKGIKTVTKDHPLIKIIDKEAEKAYLDAILKLQIEKGSPDLKIIYSPLNGAGITMIPEALKMYGFSDVEPVEEQKTPDGTFPTTPYPNPETDAALALGMRDLVEKQGDILLVSDPDSDRLSASVIYKGNPKRLTGNELGAIMLDYLIKKKKPKGKWATVTTIVSSPLIKAMTEKAGGTSFEVLTGFKYIGELIHRWEEEQDGYQFLFGFEESLGFLFGTHARDKDATIAACLAAEIALDLKKQGKSLFDKLFEIYDEFGIYREGQVVLRSDQGQEFLVAALDQLRKNPPKMLAGVKVKSMEDYMKANTGLPKANVLAFTLEDQSKFLLRPSGTEPTLKIYGHIYAKKGSLQAFETELESRLNQIKMLFSSDQKEKKIA